MDAKQTWSALLVSAIAIVCAAGGAAYADAPGDEQGGSDSGSAAEPAPPALAAPPALPAPPPPHAPTGTFYVGAAYRSGDGFGASVGVAQSNLFHSGIGLYLDGAISERLQRFSLKLSDPHIAGDRMRLDAELFNEQRVLGPALHRDAVGIDVALSTELADHTRAFVGYRFEHVAGTGELAWLRAGLSYSTLNTKLAPTSGTSAGVIFAAADDAVGSTYDLTRVDAWFDTHQALGPFIAHAGGRFSAVSSPTGVIPATELLYFGGNTDLRGFDFYDFGSYSPANAIGMWRTELELPIAHGVSVRGFWDAGGLFQWNGTGTIAQSLGGGVLWRSPIGPLSLDYAVPFGGRDVPHFLFAFGQTF